MKDELGLGNWILRQ